MVTVLFTDLVASTDALSRLGADQNESVRREHFALLRDVLTKHAGREGENGDGFMVVFAAAERRPRCGSRDATAPRRPEPARRRTAPHARRDLARGGRGRRRRLLRTARGRSGASAGSPKRRDDLSRATSYEFSRRPRGRHVFEALGALDLKGFDAPLEAYTVTWEPLSGAEIVGLPLPPRLALAADTPFVGRETEHVLLRGALAHAERTARRRVVLIGGEPGSARRRSLRRPARAPTTRARSCSTAAATRNSRSRISPGGK